MACAEIIAGRSRCHLSQVGAIIVTPDNRVVSQSYNGPPRGTPLVGDCREWCPRARDAARLGSESRRNQDPTSCVAIHAEANALLRAGWRDLQGAVIYVPSVICLNCAKLIANSGIEVVFHRVTAEYEYRQPERTEEFLRQAGVYVARLP
jgi:dCMP deaminase